VTTTRALSLRTIATLMMAGVMAWTAIAIAPASTAEASGNSFFGWTERCLMKRINRKRAARDQRKLQWDPQMGYVARRHARKMARNGGVWHDGRVGSKVTRWYRLGQNTGRTTRCRSIIRSFLNSSSHRANIFGRWSFVGSGVAKRGGYKYVQVLFESSRNPGNVWGYPSR
jgi:uncharacterized protein YkwD